MSDAERLWAHLVEQYLGRRFGLVGPRVLREPRSLRQVTLWPYSQVMHARALLALQDRPARSTLDPTPSHDAPAAPDRPRIPPMLHRYAQGDAFVARTSGGRVYLDDNGWVALAQAQDRAGRANPPWSDAARRRLAALRDAVDADGGVEWFTGGGARHACSTGSIGAALALVGDEVPGASEAAARCSHFLHEALVDADGLVNDHVDQAGRIDRVRWVYNQGLAIRLDTALAVAAPAPDGAIGSAHADAAVAGLVAGRAHFSGDILWSQPLAFVAVWFRAVIALAAHRPSAAADGLADLADYADRLRRYLAPDPGALGGGDPGAPGRYENGESLVLDLAAAVQILTLAELPEARWSDVV